MNSSLTDLAKNIDPSAGATESFQILGNISSICSPADLITSYGVFSRANPFIYSLPLLLIELTVSSGLILVSKQILKPLGQPLIVSQILVGFMLGPTVLGHIQRLTGLILPIQRFVILDSLSTFGGMFYFFLIGLQMDPNLVKKLDKRAVYMGASSISAGMLLGMPFALFIKNMSLVDVEVARSLPFVALLESLTMFPVMVQYLSELRIVNSDFGRMAISCSVVTNVITFLLSGAILLKRTSGPRSHYLLHEIFSAAMLCLIIIVLIRPICLLSIRHTRVGNPLHEDLIFAMCLTVLATGFLGQAFGLHYVFGPFVLGLAIPGGPPLGSALFQKLDYMTNWFFMPLYFHKVGQVIDLSSVGLKNYLVIQLVALVSVGGKILGTFLAAVLCKMPAKDAVAFGLIMTAQGVMDLGLLGTMRRTHLIGIEGFIVACSSMMLVTAVVSPIIIRLCDPSKRYIGFMKRTVTQMRPDSTLRVLVCVHEQENVPAAINLLDTFNLAPLMVIILHLVELIGRSSPVLITHDPAKYKRLSDETDPSEKIVRAFLNYARTSCRQIYIQAYTSISPHKTMHDDVCSLALNKATLIVVPFHRTCDGMGRSLSSRDNMRAVNRNVLDKAPCSVAILVDRGMLTSSRALLENWTCYRVAVLFLGGADDREALAIGARMAAHPSISLTLIRLVDGSSLGPGGHLLDEEVVSGFRRDMEENPRLVYIEYEVADGAGTVAVIRSMEEAYQIVIVGRRHDSRSPLLLGLQDWWEGAELGAIGEIMASPDFRGRTTILVVQQQIDPEDEHEVGYVTATASEEMQQHESEKQPILMSDLYDFRQR
uniref:Uncharacterized protein n=1 Tax=Kalanchoe fedtschenkoi TaxID=63787 RepID=A0A7N0T766_KALFE